MNSYDVGDAVTISATFAVGEVNTDPGEVTIKVKDSAGTVTTYVYGLGEVTKVATGVYSKVVNPTVAGSWHYRFEGTTTAKGAAEGVFYVRHSQFP